MNADILSLIIQYIDQDELFALRGICKYFNYRAELAIAYNRGEFISIKTTNMCNHICAFGLLMRRKFGPAGRIEQMWRYAVSFHDEKWVGRLRFADFGYLEYGNGAFLITLVSSISYKAYATLYNVEVLNPGPISFYIVRTAHSGGSFYIRETNVITAEGIRPFNFNTCRSDFILNDPGLVINVKNIIRIEAISDEFIGETAIKYRELMLDFFVI